MKIANESRWLIVLSLLFCLSGVEAKKSNSSMVNLFIGTSGDNGQVDPGATVPFGMIRVCPDSDPRSHAGYDFSVEKISGISVNRLSGVGCSGAGGNLSIKPALQTFDLHIIKQTEWAVPGYYEATFNNGVKAALTATRNIALEQYTFPKGAEALLVVDFRSSFERLISESHIVTASGEIEGSVVAPNVCGHGQYKLFFNLRTSYPFQVKSDTDGKMVLFFDKRDSKPVEIRIAVSSVSQTAANKENELVKDETFGQLKQSAAKQWDDKLSKIKVKGNSDDKILFYTSLYRVYMSPENVTSSDGQYLGTDGKVHEARNSEYYSSWSLWDTFRTKFPLLALMEPATMSDISQSLVRLYQTGKVNWSTDSEATPSVRTEHAIILLLDAYRKGIKGIDFRACYPQLRQEAKDLLKNSPDQKLESACDLWAMAQIADIIGEKVDAAEYRMQSEQLFEKTWKQEFMKIDSSYTKMGGNGLYQGTRWQYRWAVPQYLDNMIVWAGGKETLNAQLTDFFDQHLYNQGNEPDIHVPYLFNRLGSPEKTQRCVYDLLCEKIVHKYGGNAEYRTPYVGRAYKNSPEGYMPEMDEDDGTMGAWYVFSAMGIYPLIVGEPVYDLTSPLFEHIILQLENGKTFTIKTSNRKKATAPVKNILLNGKKHASWQLSHDVIMNGGKLVFQY